MATKYHFLSSYSMTSDPATVWAALQAIQDWPSWWRWLKRVEVVRQASGADGVGAIYRNHVRAKTGYGFVYSTEIAEVDHLRRLDLLSSGDIEGRGRFLIAARPDGGTDLSFAWLVQTPKWWMNLLAPIARPAFTWNHDYLMTDFGKGLAAHTGGELTSVRNQTLSPKDPGFHVMPTSPG
jgi:hypothetical protein